MYLMIIIGFIFIFIFFILPIIQNISDYSKDKIESIREDIEKRKEETHLISKIQKDEEVYQAHKRKFQYFSNETLLKIYETKKSNESLYILLALEEILVERKLIDFSPTHELLHTILNNFSTEN